MSVSWTLPWPAGGSVNHLYLRRRDGGLRLNPRYLDWRDHVILIYRQSGRELPPGRVSLRIDYWPPRDGRVHDPDNLLKGVQDALFLAAGEVDNRVWHSEATRHEADGNPRVVVTVEPFEDE